MVLKMLARLSAILGLMVGLQALAGCDLPLEQGFSSVSAEQARIRAEGFHVVSLDEDRAVILAKGRQVAIEPASGFCLARDSVETSKLSAFALIGDCALDKTPDKSKRGARGELRLPRGVPGIITVSVSGNPQLEKAGGLKGMEAFLKTPAGRKMLGRGVDPFDVKVRKTAQIDNGIYVLVEDSGEGVLPVLSKRFWRGFVQVNDRLAVVTVSGFRARPLGEKEMLEYLVDQVKTLTVANATPLNEPQQILVADAGASGAGKVESGAVALTDVKPEALQVAVVKPGGPTKAPQPQRRPLSVLASSELLKQKNDAPDPEKIAAAVSFAKKDAEQKSAAKAKSKIEAEQKAIKVIPAPSIPVKKTSKLAIAPQAVQPSVRPSSETQKKNATKLAPSKAPSAPKRPAV